VHSEVNLTLISREITVQGEVQQVGYRRRIWNIAKRLTIKGYVRNMPDGSVTILAQGDENSMKQFVDALKITEPPILVDSIDVRDTKVKKVFKDFRIKAGSMAEELQEGLGAGESQLYMLRTEFRDYRTEFRDYRTEFRDYRTEFGGFAQRTDENFNRLETKYGEISEKLTMIMGTLQKESMETRTQLIRSVDALTELIRSKLE
jgi:acylphosphatase